jgi:hypothetical protein
MGTVLSKGWRLPATGDRDWWDQLEANITQSNSHDHDGTDSEAISTKNLSKSTSTILAAAWAAVSGHAGTFSQTITVPSGYTVNNSDVKFYITSSGIQIHPTTRYVSSTTYDVFVNDNTLALTAVYG